MTTILSAYFKDYTCRLNTSLLRTIVIVFIFLSLNSCKPEEENPVKETGTVTDIDGNIYQTIKIGNQWWMAENLRVTRYNDSSLITQLTILSNPDTIWANRTTEAYCNFDNNYNPVYGLLYNWYAVSESRKLAPAGWHIPADDEWKELELYLGMSQENTDKLNWRGNNEGDKLKAEGPLGWSFYENVWGTNESGFSALGGCCCVFNGYFGNPGLQSTGFWWSSSLKDEQAWYRYLDYKNSNIFRYYGPKTYGFSVRCVKD